jgi:hypothetical protein
MSELCFEKLIWHRSLLIELFDATFARDYTSSSIRL